MLLVCVCIHFKVKHDNVGLRLRKGVSPDPLPPNSIQRCKYRLCAHCTHWRTCTIYTFKEKAMYSISCWFTLILCLFAHSVFVQQLHTDEIGTSGLLTISYANRVLLGNIQYLKKQHRIFLHHTTTKYLFYTVELFFSFILTRKGFHGDTCPFIYPLGSC